jgi:hypothetical protein
MYTGGDGVNGLDIGGAEACRHRPGWIQRVCVATVHPKWDPWPTKMKEVLNLT